MLHFFDLSPVHLPNRSHGADDCFYCSWRDVPRNWSIAPANGRALWAHDFGDAIVASPTLEPNGLLVMTTGRPPVPPRLD